MERAFCRKCHGPASLLEQEQRCLTRWDELGLEGDPSTCSPLSVEVQSHRARTGYWWQGLAVNHDSEPGPGSTQGVPREAAGDKAGGRAWYKLEFA